MDNSSTSRGLETSKETTATPKDTATATGHETITTTKGIVIEDYIRRYYPPDKPHVPCSLLWLFCGCWFYPTIPDGKWKDAVMLIEVEEKAFIKLYEDSERKSDIAGIGLAQVYDHIVTGASIDHQPGKPKFPKNANLELFMAIPEESYYDNGERHWVIFKDEDQMREWTVTMKELVKREASISVYDASHYFSIDSNVDVPTISESSTVFGTPSTSNSREIHQSPILKSGGEKKTKL